MNKLKMALCAIFVFSTLITPAVAQEVYQDVQGFWKAKVVEVITDEEKILPGTETKVLYQELKVEILEGEKKGEQIEIINDFIRLKKGQTFFLNYMVTIDGSELYTVRDIERRPVVLGFAIIFALVILLFGGKQGVRSLLSLTGSLLIILFILLPLLLKGYPPVLTSALIASVILFLAIFLTHGFNRESLAAFLGTVGAVVATAILAFIAVRMAYLSGFATDEAVFLNMSTSGTLNMAGLLLGSIIIGVLGVLDDIAITQATVVRELYGTAPHLSKLELYKTAIRVGKEHVGALVNTLALAYTGASLPILLLFVGSAQDTSFILNYEVFATEIIRTIVGSIGLVLAVPLSTYLAVVLLKDKKGKPLEEVHTHHHHHHHVHHHH